MSDLIDRQAAIDYIKSQRGRLFKGFTIEEAVLTLIREVPSTPERKKGKWINHRNDMGHNIADCSECGEAMQWYDPDTRPNFCPNCGADMRGET